MILSRRFWLTALSLLIGGILFVPFYVMLAIQPFLPTTFRVVPAWYEFLVLFHVLRALLFSNLTVYLAISLLGIGAGVVALLWVRPHWFVRLILVLSLLAIIAFPWVFRYRPALVAAPGYAMRVPTQPGLLDGVVKLNQSIVEIQPCEYTLLGWSADAILYYQVQCDSDPAQTWAIAPDRETNARLVTTVPADLFVDRASISLFDRVRADTVSPASEEPNARRVHLREGSLISHDGSWVALIAWHVYGPEDVVIVQGVVPSE